MMKEQTYGVEVEVTGVTRKQLAKALAKHFGTEVRNCTVSPSYKMTLLVADTNGNDWKIEYDGSIAAQKKAGGMKIGASDLYKAELVSPILRYEDLEMLQDVVRVARKAGAFVNTSCGMHVHVGANLHTAKTVRNLVNIMASKQDMLYEAINVRRDGVVRWAKKVNTDFLTRLNAKKPATTSELQTEWYEGYESNTSRNYHSSRYHGLNLHAMKMKGTVEFRMFNATLHAGEVKSYVQLALALSAQALQKRSASPKATQPMPSGKKMTMLAWMQNWGMCGEEFKTARLHLTKHFDTNNESWGC